MDRRKAGHGSGSGRQRPVEQVKPRSWLQMAARRAVASRTRGRGRGRSRRLEVATEEESTSTANGEGYFSSNFPDHISTGLDSAEILGASHGYADQTIISIIEDSSPSENKCPLDEESEAMLLTALNDILDAVDDENPSPFDTLPDTKLFTSAKDLHDELLGVERHSWASFPDLGKDLVEPAAPQGVLWRSEELAKKNHGEEKWLCHLGDEASSVCDAVLEQLDTAGLEDSVTSVLEENVPCVINVEHVSLSDLIKFIHPYCLPSDPATSTVHLEVIQKGEVDILCEGHQVPFRPVHRSEVFSSDEKPMIAGVLHLGTLPGVQGTGPASTALPGALLGPDRPDSVQQENPPTRRKRGRPRKTAKPVGSAAVRVCRVEPPLTRSSLRAQLQAVSGAQELQAGLAVGLQETGRFRQQMDHAGLVTRRMQSRGRAVTRGQGRRRMLGNQRIASPQRQAPQTCGLRGSSHIHEGGEVGEPHSTAGRLQRDSNTPEGAEGREVKPGSRLPPPAPLGLLPPALPSPSGSPQLLPQTPSGPPPPALQSHSRLPPLALPSPSESPPPSPLALPPPAAPLAPLQPPTACSPTTTELRVRPISLEQYRQRLQQRLRDEVPRTSDPPPGSNPSGAWPVVPIHSIVHGQLSVLPLGHITSPTGLSVPNHSPLEQGQAAGPWHRNNGPTPHGKVPEPHGNTTVPHSDALALNCTSSCAQNATMAKALSQATTLISAQSTPLVFQSAQCSRPSQESAYPVPIPSQIPAMSVPTTSCVLAAVVSMQGQAPAVPVPMPTHVPAVLVPKLSRAPSLPVPAVPVPAPSRVPAVPVPAPSRVPAVPVPAPSRVPAVPVPATSRVPAVPVPAPSRVPAVPVPAPSRVPAVPVPAPSRVPAVPVPAPSRVPAVPVPAPSRVPAVPVPAPSRVPAVPVPAPSRVPAVPVPAPSRVPAVPVPAPSRVPAVPVPAPSRVPAVPVPAPSRVPAVPVPAPSRVPAVPVPAPSRVPAVPVPAPSRVPAVPVPAPSRVPAVPGPAPSRVPAVPGPAPSRVPAVPGPAPSRVPAVPGPAPSRVPAVPGPAPSRVPAVPVPAASRVPAVPGPAPSRVPAVPGPAPSRVPAVPGPAPSRVPAVPGPAPSRVPAVPGPAPSRAPAVPGPILTMKSTPVLGRTLPVHPPCLVHIQTPLAAPTSSPGPTLPAHPAFGENRLNMQSKLSQDGPVTSPRGPVASSGHLRLLHQSTPTQHQCSRMSAIEHLRRSVAIYNIQEVPAKDNAEGIEAGDVMSLLEQFEVTEGHEEQSLGGGSGTEMPDEKRFLDHVLAAELASTAGLTPPATPPHQCWKSLVSVGSHAESGPVSPHLSGRRTEAQVVQNRHTMCVGALSPPRMSNSTATPNTAHRDHEYCLPSVDRLIPRPTPRPNVGCRWNVKRHANIVIKPITLLKHRPEKSRSHVLAAGLPSHGGSHVDQHRLTGEDVLPLKLQGGAERHSSQTCSPTQGGSHIEEEPLDSFENRGRSQASPCYSRECSSSSCSSSRSCSRSRSRSPAQKRRRCYRRRSRHSRHSSQSDSRSSSQSRSYSRSTSGSRSRSRSPQRRSARMSYFTDEFDPYDVGSRHRYRYSRQEAQEHSVSQQRELAIEERRVVYVGKIRTGMMREELRRRFEVFGEIEDCNIYFRTRGDNYGFVTFRYTCDAFAAIENGQSVRGPDEMPFDLCFGGRRQFCKTNYTDLDSSHNDISSYSNKSKFDSLDFDTLLKQAKRNLRR
ncbi:peroxisome proliferator-activated receptor gamma coactivator-related protein 1-like [Narcine bancroftii]|uniref:peroxisome proliferator-activated receptor gamma coactivator-related protein 1-like n=1 Tax=Narcine bancroftii TaxID=1343680 RepID=UPI003831EB68